MLEVKLFSNEPVLVTKCYDGNLHEVNISKKVDISDLQWRHFFKRLFQAVKFLHSMGLVHRDLKPGNIMVEVRDVPEDEKFNPVIIDFGFVNESFGPLGTPGYMPSEAFEEKPASIS